MVVYTPLNWSCFPFCGNWHSWSPELAGALCAASSLFSGLCPANSSCLVFPASQLRELPGLLLGFLLLGETLKPLSRQ